MRSHQLRRLALAATFAVTALAPDTISSATAGATSTAQSLNPLTGAEQQDFVNRVNAVRATGRTCGETFYPAAAPLTLDSRLNNAATNHSVDMASRNYFDHTNPEGVTFGDRITQAGYPWHAAVENIAAGYPRVAATVDQWLNSPGHCANIMQADLTNVGIGRASNRRATYKHYWTMDGALP